MPTYFFKPRNCKKDEVVGLTKATDEYEATLIFAETKKLTIKAFTRIYEVKERKS